MKRKNGIRLLSAILVLSLAVMVMASCTGVEDIVSFKVDFIVDGNVYDTLKTGGNETIALPSNPTKEGYVFKGWYWDNETWQQPFTANSLLNAPLSGDMKIYARFEKIESAIVSSSPVPGTAYKLFIDQENAGKRCYIDGTVSGYYLGVVSDIASAANVYVEESGIPERFFMYCVKDGARKYINIVKVGDYYNAVYNNAPITAYVFNTTLKTMVATVDGAELLLGTNSAVDYERIGTRYLNESSFVAHLAVSSNPDSVIPDASVEEVTVGEIIAGLIGSYKTHGTVVGVNTQSFLLGDGGNYILVYNGAAWTPDVEVGDTVEVEGKTSKYGNAIQFEKGASYTVTGTVYGINAQSFLVNDGTGYILVYRGADWVCDVDIASVVEITGTVSMYGGAYQFGKDAATYEIVDMETVVYPDSIHLTGEDVDAYASRNPIIPEFVRVKGTLVVSGNYYNLEIDGADLIGSITYPTDDIGVFDGCELVVEGYVTGVTGDRYLNILAIDIVEADNSSSGESGTTEEKTILYTYKTDKKTIILYSDYTALYNEKVYTDDGNVEIRECEGSWYESDDGTACVKTEYGEDTFMIDESVIPNDSTTAT